MKQITLMSAEHMGRAAEFDPQFKMPEKPRFSSDFQVIPIEDGILVHGGESLQVLRGNATKFLPQLLPLLDGTKTQQDLIAQFPQYPPQALKNVFALLYARGLLEDGQGDEGVDLQAFAPEVLSFFRRHTDATRVNRSAGEGLSRLQKSKVAVFCDGHPGEILYSELKNVGFGGVRVERLEEEIDPKEANFVVAFVAGALDHQKLQLLDRICADRNIPWILSRVSGSKGMLGPYFERGETACYECFQAAYSEQQMDEETPYEYIEMWEQYTSLELSYFLSRLVPAVTGLDSILFDFTDWSRQSYRITRRPGCPNCHALNGINTTEPEIAIKFEQSIAFPSRNLLNPKDHQVHYRTSNLELTRDSKAYPSAPLIALPEEGGLPVIEGDFLSGLFRQNKRSSSPVTLQSLGRLLVTGAGFRRLSSEEDKPGAKNQRWAPTGGNLGSAQIYLWNRNVDGLAPNLYFYQPANHTLVRVGPERSMAEVEAAIAVAMVETAVSLPDALFVLTGAFARVVSKYHAFAYRIIHLDTGVAVAQLNAAAIGLGLEVKILHNWNEPFLAKNLDIDKFHEPVTAVCTLTSGRESQ